MKKLDLSGIGGFPRIEYQHIAASFLAKTYGVSRATVYNLVNSFEIPKLDIERFEKDDAHMKFRRSRNTYGKSHR